MFIVLQSTPPEGRLSMRLPSQLAQAPYRFQPHAAIVIRAFSEADSERIGVQLAVARHGAEPLEHSARTFGDRPRLLPDPPREVPSDINSIALSPIDIADSRLLDGDLWRPKGNVVCPLLLRYVIGDTS